MAVGVFATTFKFMSFILRCDSMPDFIWFFGSVVTIEADDACTFLLMYSNDLSEDAGKFYNIFFNRKKPNDQSREIKHATKRQHFKKAGLLVNMHIFSDMDVFFIS